MKTIAFYNPEYALPIPAIGGGAVEELEHILADENEKSETYKFIFFQPEPTFEQKQIINQYHFKHTQLAFVKKGKHGFFYRVIRKLFKIINIKLKTKYERNFLHKLNNYKVDKIVFEGNCPISTLKFLSRKYGKENLYLHIHSNYQPNFEIIKNVGHLIGVSNFVLKPWSVFCNSNCLTPIMHDVLKNCVRNEKFARKITLTERNTLRQKLGFKSDDFVIIFCGRIIPEKGVLELMQAVCAIKNQKIKLLVIGSPNFTRITKSDYLADVEKCATKHADKIVFSGYVDNRELYKYYHSSDLQVVPSLYEDPAPLVVIEGMLSGLPQIVTNSGGVPEYIDENGCIVVKKESQFIENLAHVIKTLSENRKRLLAMGQNNLTKSQKINYTNIFYGNFKTIMEKQNG